MKKVEDFMNSKVAFLSPEDSIFDAAKLFAKINISGAPVVENEKVVGVVSISDIIKYIDIKMGKLPKIQYPGLSTLILAIVQIEKAQIDFKKELKKLASTKVKSIMTKKVRTIHSEKNVMDAAEMMERYDVNRVPVVDDGKLVGIIARADVIGAVID